MTRKKKTVTTLAGLAIIAGAGGIFWANTNSHGTVVGASPARTAQVELEQRLQGDYVDFEFDGSYAPRKANFKGDDLELITLTAGTNYEKRLNVSISKATAQGLNGNSAYLLRESLPNVYTKYQATAGDATAIVWRKNDNLEQTVLIPKGDKIAMLVFVTTGAYDDLDLEVAELLKTFRWKQ